MCYSNEVYGGYRFKTSRVLSRNVNYSIFVFSSSFKLKAVSIALDGKNNGWAIDEDGVVWFRTGVTADTPQGSEDKWWQVCILGYSI